MLETQYDFNAGLDPSALSSLTAAQLLQMIQQMAPLSNVGGVIVGAGASLNATIPEGTGSPSVTNNPRFARYIWLNTYSAASAPPTPYYYDASTGNWTSTAVAAGSIVNASISATAEIAVSKLADGAANEIIRTDAAGTGVEWVTVATLLAALNDSVPLTAIDDTAAVGATSFLRRDGSTVVWKTFAETVTAIQAALSSVAPSVLAAGSNNTILGTNGSGVVAFDTPNNIIANLALSLAKLAAGGASTGDYLRFDGTNWAKATPAVGFSSSNAISTVGVTSANDIATNTHVFTHGLGGTPKLVRAVLVCQATGVDGDFLINDELDVFSVSDTAADAEPAFSVTVAPVAGTIVVSLEGGAMRASVKAGGSKVALTDTNWKPKVYAWL